MPQYLFRSGPDGSDGKEFACSAGDPGLIHGLGRSPEEGLGYLLQYSGLENSIDFLVHGVAKSWARLSDFHCHLQVVGKLESLLCYLGSWKIGTRISRCICIFAYSVCCIFVNRNFYW